MSKDEDLILKLNTEFICKDGRVIAFKGKDNQLYYNVTKRDLYQGDINYLNRKGIRRDKNIFDNSYFIYTLCKSKEVITLYESEVINNIVNKEAYTSCMEINNKGTENAVEEVESQDSSDIIKEGESFDNTRFTKEEYDEVIKEYFKDTYSFHNRSIQEIDDIRNKVLISNRPLNKKIPKKKDTMEDKDLVKINICHSTLRKSFQTQNLSTSELLKAINTGCSIITIDSPDYPTTNLFWVDVDDVEECSIYTNILPSIKDIIQARPYIIAQSFSGTGWHICYRLEESITAEEYEKLYKVIAWNHQSIDPCCFNNNRLFYGTQPPFKVEKYSDDVVRVGDLKASIECYDKFEKDIKNYYSSLDTKEYAGRKITEKITGVNSDEFKNYEVKDNEKLRDFVFNRIDSYVDVDEVMFKYYPDFYNDGKKNSLGFIDYNCPFHDGADGHNLKRLKSRETREYVNALKCFSGCCGENYYIYKIIQIKYNVKDFKDVYLYMCRDFEIPIDRDIVDTDDNKLKPNNAKLRGKKGSGEEATDIGEEVEVTLEDFDMEELDKLLAKDKKRNYKKTTSNIRIIMDFVGIKFRCNQENNGLEMYGNTSLLEGELTNTNSVASSIENLLIEMDYKIPLKTIKLYLSDIVSKLGVLDEETFSQKRAVDLIIEKYRVKTFGKDIYMYIDGGYVKDKEEKLQSAVWAILPEKFATSNVRDSICKVIASNTCVLATDDRDYISFSNGLLNVKTWELEPNSDTVFCIYKKKANYKPFNKEEFEKSALKRYLDTTFKGNQKLIDLFQFILANAIRPEPKKFTYLVHFLGGGSNGKSLAVKIIEEVATVVSTQGIETLGTNNFSTSGLVGSNVNICSETSSATIRNSATLKALATGDIINVEYKFQQPKSMEIPIMMVFNENTMPRCNDTTDGWNRRQLIVPFEQKFVYEDELPRNPFALPIDITLEPTIINKEKDLLFSWVIEGLKKLMAQNYKIEVPKECRRMKEKYEGENDPVGAYIKYLKDSFKGEYEQVTLDQFREKLQKWCFINNYYLNEDDTTNQKLGRILDQYNIRKQKDRGDGGKFKYSIQKVIEI